MKTVTNITKNNYKQWNSNAKHVRAKALDWTPDIDDEFLNHVLPILASIPLVRNGDNLIDSSLILSNLDNEHIIETPNGKMTGRNIRYLLGFLYQQPRASLIQGTQIRNPILASLTPLMLYANKLYNDVEYSEWDKKSPGMGIMLGHTLQPILEITSDLILSSSEIISLREEALTFKTGKRQGQAASLITYKMNINRITFDEGDSIEVPKIALFMYLQLWLANLEIRNSESMILDPFSWSNIPATVDEQPDRPGKVRGTKEQAGRDSFLNFI